MTKISIIMPVFNSEEYLREAIQSIQDQTMSDIELICVDDGSTDGSLDILNDLSSKFDFIQVFSQENQGSGSARNKGLDVAKGEFIAFLDSDDIYIDNNALKIMYDTAKLHDADIVSANLSSFTPNRNLLNKLHNCKKHICFDDYCEISPKDYGIPWSFYKNIFKRRIIEEYHIRFPDLLRGQDPVFLVEFLSKVDKIYGVPIYFYGYMVSPYGTNLLNTSIKKYHYFIHYKEVFAILDENNFEKTSKKYKRDLIKRLKNFNSSKDIEAYELFVEVFKDCMNYLEDFKMDLDFIYFSYLFNKILIEDSQEYFEFVKNELNGYEFWKNNKISKPLLRKIILINSYNQYSDFRVEYLELDCKINRNIVSSQKKKNKKLEDNFKSVKKTNDELLNSNSLKLLRKVKSFKL